MATVCCVCKKEGIGENKLANITVTATCGVHVSDELCPKCQKALLGKIVALGFTPVDTENVGLGSAGPQ